MDLLLQPYLCLLFSFMILLIAISKFKLGPKSRTPPGPPKLPLIGNLHQLIGSSTHREITKLAERFGPVMHLQLGEMQTVIISSAELAKEILMTKDLSFANRPELTTAKTGTYNYTDVAFAPYGNYWRQVKKICVLELLSAKRVQSFRSIRENEVHNLIKHLSDSQGAPINLSNKIFSLLCHITSKAAFGEKYQPDDNIVSIFEESSKLAARVVILDIFPSVKFLHWITGAKATMEKIQGNFDKTVSKIVEDHRAQRRARMGNNDLSAEKDLLDVLLNLQESNDLGFYFTTDNIKAVILDMFNAGIETSSTTIEWAFSELVKNPMLMTKAQKEVRDVVQGKRDVDESDIEKMIYLKRIIKETLRLHPPAPFLLPREARETCEINGYEIPIKTSVLINCWAISRDPKYWVDPERFDPDRFKGSSIDFKGTNSEFLPFGAGRRICPGIMFGVALVELALAQLLYHFDWNLPNGKNLEELDMTEVLGLTLRRKHDLQLVAIPYTP